ncbi:MAG: creatininase family protein, partial [Thermoleophilia bacterium]|nr:creatininase family protein [Thermoleophilia bacterium]
WEPRWDGDAHAGRTETSLMLALAPSRVRPDAARAGNVDPIEQLIVELAECGVRELSGNGVLGDPTGASAAEGEELLDVAAAQLVEAIQAWFGIARTRTVVP